ncbi:hypothetical protein [Ectothiorhodospira sp. BSL-9]|uniref:hypothetical protein n=1 Tax=Ectothiorhodospira sp. BSL-9 TaxID=1442136 RepID=UPI0007B43B7C|nr:hypothetical protein [Ectothiorhodospira sp. BSL-9]ANB02099.1 hypothetical protein ECTOBSL9_1391 [Ectothiorhodospira sp. BSL-9]TVQ74950.1 MAG: hypothetical protein EA372_01075 [Chromatiaceae bacterium]
MLQYLTAFLIIFALFTAWVLVQHAARRFAQRHPEFGPAKEEGGGCASGCGGCASAHSCGKKTSP